MKRRQSGSSPEYALYSSENEPLRWAVMSGFKFLFDFSCILLVMISVLTGETYTQNLHLNEIMSANDATFTDENGDYQDWIEIFNSGDDPVELPGYGLSDDKDEPLKWIFPDTTIRPGEFMLIWASNKNRNITGEELHTNFAVSAGGEEVTLTHPDGTLLDELPPTEIPADISIGRKPDGTGEWLFFDEPTPSEANTTESISDVLEPPVLSHNPGFYASGFDLELSHPREDVTFYYTLDGSAPTELSAVYNGPVSIVDRSGDPNFYSTIPTNFMNDRFGFQEPAELIPKGTILRIKTVKEGFLPSESSHSFFIFPEGSSAHSLPVISISTDRQNLFGDEEGIYVPGIYHTEGNDGTGNYYQRGEEWEREAAFEFFDENGELQFTQNVGLRIHGGFTRRYAQKSLRVYARSEYGESSINYPVFPDQDYDSYERLLLRNSGNDQGYTMFRDAAAHMLVRHFNMDTQAYRPAVVYINGEYWGIHNIRERFDDNYLERVYEVDPGQIDYLSGHWDIQYGANWQYQNVVNFIDSADLADDTNMDEVKTMIDLDNFLDYYTAQIYLVNTDWPHGNIDYWRLRVPYTEDAPYGHDGRWRWLFYDIDFGFGFVRKADFDMLHYVTQQHAYQDLEWVNLILRNLLENESFKYDFINRMADHLNTSFRTDRVLELINSLQKQIEPEMPEFIKRWGHPTTMGQWNGFVNIMRNFAEERPGFLRQNIIDHFDLESTETITVDVHNPEQGNVIVNSLLISPDTPGVPENSWPWTGVYFFGIPVTLKPNPETGFHFSHWVIDGEEEFTKELSILPGEAEQITAVFDELSLSGIEPHAVANNPYLFDGWNEDEPAGTYPEHMAFVYMNESDPGLNASVADITGGAYNLDSRTRINGRGGDGFSFLNTGISDGNPGYPDTRLGGAVLALDTRNIAAAEVGWEAGTVEPNPRIYNLRLQYRIGSEGEFKDIRDGEGNPVEYLQNEEKGHSEFIGPFALPDDAINQPRVELFWRYYYTGEKTDEESNQRSELNISAIHVAEIPEMRIPDAFDLGSSHYEFSYWPADTTVGVSPPSMEFAYMNQADPGLDAFVLGYTSGAFYYDSRTRVNGRWTEGFAFINTSSFEGNPGYPGTRLGGALLALNTNDRYNIKIEWTGGTVEPNSRIYNLRLQYRTDVDEPFRDVLDEEGNPVEYRRNENPRHSMHLAPVTLPQDAEDQPYVQLFWRYYYTGERANEASGRRAMLHVTNIRIDSQPLFGEDPGPPKEFQLFQNYPNPFYPFTTIRYNLPSDQHVRLDLFSIDGRHIAVLEDKHAEAGRHTVEVDVSSLASGIYLYRLVSDDYSVIKKMSVVK